MTADDAEDLGRKVFSGSVKSCLEALAGDGAGYRLHGTFDGLADTHTVLEGLREEATTTGPDSLDLSLRGYISPSSDFKRSFAERSPDPIACTQVQVASLPKYVWIIEVIRRSERHLHHPCVLGEVVLDATDIDLREANAYVVHLPGAIRIRGRVAGGRWHVTGMTDLYQSGRYHPMPGSFPGRELASRWKKTQP